MSISKNSQKVIFLLVGALCLTPWIGPPLALGLGIIIALAMGSVFGKDRINKLTSWLLKGAVVGLGFGMNINTALEVGEKGLFYTIISIGATLILGYFLGKQLKVDKKITALISSGTAICGGSAIAAMSPVIKANDRQISIALGTVFILNSVALFVFPFIGDALNLTQMQFGYWAAIAIHDTSSVVGAASAYGTEALQIATSVKLGRALWILPLSLIGSLIYKSGSSSISIPYFILLFVVAMLLNTFVPAVSNLATWIVPISKELLTVTLFLIGTGLSLKVIKNVGARPLVKGVLLWIFIATGSLWMILAIPF
jgi:uncharacterized integral membrane protein (TIGR00698 family)